MCQQQLGGDGFDELDEKMPRLLGGTFDSLPQ